VRGGDETVPGAGKRGGVIIIIIIIIIISSHPLGFQEDNQIVVFF